MAKLYKERVLSSTPALHRLLLRLPRVHQIDRLLIQSGSSLSVWHFVVICGLLALAGLLLGLVLRWSFLWIILAMALMAELPVLVPEMEKQQTVAAHRSAAA